MISFHKIAFPLGSHSFDDEISISENKSRCHLPTLVVAKKTLETLPLPRKDRDFACVSGVDPDDHPDDHSVRRARWRPTSFILPACPPEPASHTGSREPDLRNILVSIKEQETQYLLLDFSLRMNSTGITTVEQGWGPKVHSDPKMSHLATKSHLVENKMDSISVGSGFRGARDQDPLEGGRLRRRCWGGGSRSATRSQRSIPTRAAWRMVHVNLVWSKSLSFRNLET